MNKKIDQYGISALFVLILILVIAIAGGVGYYVWQKQESKIAANNNTVTPAINNKSTTFIMNTSPLLGGSCAYRTVVSGSTGTCINQEDAINIINSNAAKISDAKAANPNSLIQVKVTALVTNSTKDIPAGVYPGAKIEKTQFINIKKLQKVEIITVANP